jgi:hypothetical protein
MFHQYVADGGNLFIAIVAVIVGFAAAMGYTDSLKTKNDKNSPYDKKD